VRWHLKNLIKNKLQLTVGRLAFVADFGTQNFNFKTNFNMENNTLTNHENGNDANRLLASVFDYDFKEIEQHIIGGYSVSDWFSFTIYSDKAPSKGKKLLLNNKIYEVESVIDDTDDDEFEQGLSYSKVWLSLYGC
jgi:hypothetical protein